jgi:hypothetical protein
VLGDLAESGASLRDVLGLVGRRHAALLKSWKPWAIFAGMVIPFALFLSLIAMLAANGSAVTLWLYFNNWDWNLFSIESFRHDLVRFLSLIPLRFLHLTCWSWGLGFLLGLISRRMILITGVLLFLGLLVGGSPGVPLIALKYVSGSRALNYSPNGAVFEVQFYRVVFPLIVQSVLVLLPAAAGMFEGARVGGKRIFRIAAWALVFMVLVQGAVLLWAGHNVRSEIWRASLFHSFEFLPYWPVVYWLTTMIQNRRRLRLA